jgi:hypothetical protein
MVLDKLITLEDANTLLSLNPNFSMDYVINTGLIPREYFEDGFEDYIYDFNIINMNKEKGVIKLSTENTSSEAKYSFGEKISNCIINFKIMLESNNTNNNQILLKIQGNEDIFTMDLISEMPINQSTSQSNWYEMTIIVTEDYVQILLYDDFLKDYHLPNSDDIKIFFDIINNTTIQTVNIKDLQYSKIEGKIVFNDEGNNIHWTSDDGIERIFKDGYTQVKGTGYTRPNYDDVYTETKLYKNKNHIIEFDYKHNINDLIIFNDLGTSNSHNTHYNKLSGLISYTSTDTVFTYTNNDILNLNYYIPQCELKGDWTLNFKLKTTNLSRTYFVFTNELRNTVPSEDDISAEQYKTNLTGLSANTEYYFKIVKIDNQISIKYSTNGNTYNNFKTLTVDEDLLYFNFVLNGMSQYNVTINFNNMVIYNNNKLSLVLSNYDHTAETLIEKLSLSEDANIKILLIGVKVFLLIDNVYIKSLIMEDDYAYTLFNFMIEDGIFDYNNFKMYTYDNDDTIQINSADIIKCKTDKLMTLNNLLKLKIYDNNNKDYYINLQSGSFNYEDKFTLSFWAKKNSGNGNIRCYLYGGINYVQNKVIAHNGTYGNTQFGDGQTRFTLTDEWKRYYVTWELDNETDSISKGKNINTYKTSCIRIFDDDKDVEITGAKLERGTLDSSNVDTYLLLENNKDSVISEDSLYHYIVEVYNKLWTGEVTFDRLSENEDIILYTDNKLNYNNETYIFHTICSDDDFDIILKLNNNYDEERVFEDIKPTIEYKDETWLDKYKMFYTYKMSVSSDKNSYSYVYYNEPYITITVKDMYGQKIQGAKVIIPNTIYNTQTTLITNSNGEVIFKPKRLKPDTYNAKVVIKKDPYDSESKNISYNDTSLNIQLKPKKEDLSITYNAGNTYWGGYVNDSIKINANTNYKVDVSVNCNKSLINSKVNKSVTTNSSFTHEQSYRTKRYKDSSITISVKGNDWCNSYKKSFTKKHSLKYVDNWTQLKNEIDNTKGVDIVGLKQKNYTVDDDVIYYKRDMEIVGINNNESWATIKGAKKYCFVNKSPSKSKYINFKITNVEFFSNVKVFKHNAYANLEIENCLFYKNGKGNSNIGICIETPITDNYIDKNYGNIKVTSCNFINNKGSNIGTSMNVNVDTCRFGLTDWEYAQHPQCWAMEIYGQKATVKDCDFAISMSGKSPLSVLRHSNFSHGKAILRIGTSAYVNGTKGSSCKKNNSSPLLYNGNTSYLYAKYKYNGVNVTASPTRNHERSAHDIVVNGTDWAWKNNVNVSTVYDNTKEKPKITVPKSPKDNAKILKKGGRQKW